MFASGELRDQLKPALRASFVVIQDVDIDLQLDRADRPGTVRRPDLVVVERSAVQRVRVEGGFLRASEVLLVVEIVSPGSRRMDYMIKRSEYADAGIPYYWIVDLNPASLQACHKAEDAAGYLDDAKAKLPFPVTIDLGAMSALLR